MDNISFIIIKHDYAVNWFNREICPIIAQLRAKKLQR